MQSEHPPGLSQLIVVDVVDEEDERINVKYLKGSRLVQSDLTDSSTSVVA